MKSPVPGTLFVVATPIGNLEDITLRALRVLREVALVAAEDTRRTRNLLRHYQIATPLISLHAHNEHERQVELLRRLGVGESIALVSDAGTPGISDPGAKMVRGARDGGHRVEPIPGPSAVTAVLSAAGVAVDRFAFAGFPPVRSNDRIIWFKWVASLPDTPVVVFEAPHRLKRTLDDLGIYLVDRPIILARELTKIHEEWLSGSPNSLANHFLNPKGEFVLILGPTTSQSGGQPIPTDAEVARIFGQMIEIGCGSRRETIKAVAESLALSPKTVYTALERHKNSGK